MTLPIANAKCVTSMEKISRTQKKKNALALQKLGERLIALTEEQMNDLDLIPELKEAVLMARQMTKHEARRRQMQYVGRLMREVDPEVIENALADIQAQKDQERRRFKLIEQWRDELVAGSDDRASWLISQHPDINRQKLVRLVNQARDAKNTPKGRQAGRRLFRFLARNVLMQP